MANRRVIQEEIKGLQKNTKDTWSRIGELIPQRQNVKIDDTIGPVFDLHFLEGEVNSGYVFIKIKVWDASQIQLKGLVYERTYAEYQIQQYNTPLLIFRRYRTPFKKLEFDLENMEHPPGHPITYKGNPDLQLNAGDVISVEMYSPFILDVKKSSISLELLVLDGHVGPEYIGIESMENRVKQDAGRSFTVGQSSSSDYAEVDGERRMEENQNSPGELSILDKDLITLQYVRAKIHEIKRTTGKNPDRKTILSLIKEYCSDEDIMYFLERYSCFDKK